MAGLMDETLKIAKDGLSLEDFKSSDVGRFFYERADNMRRDAENEFYTVDAEDPKAIREIQNKLKVVAMFVDFIEAGIAEGRLAQMDYERLAD